MKKKFGKLALSKETIRALNAQPLRDVVGGIVRTDTCYATCSEESCFRTCDTCLAACPTEVSACVSDCGC